MGYVIKLNSKKLTGFVSGDLPSNGKMFEQKKYKDSHMFVCYNNGYALFNTRIGALDYIAHIKHEIKRNAERYDNYLKGSSEKLMAKANKLVVVEDDGKF